MTGGVVGEGPLCDEAGGSVVTRSYAQGEGGQCQESVVLRPGLWRDTEPSDPDWRDSLNNVLVTLKLVTSTNKISPKVGNFDNN